MLLDSRREYGLKIGAYRFSRNNLDLGILKFGLFQKAEQFDLAESEPKISVQLSGSFKGVSE